MPVTIAYEIGIRSLPLPKFFSLFKCLKLKRVSSYFAFPRTILGLFYISLLDARLSGTCLLMSACCNSCKQKQFTIFRAHVYLQTERWRSYTSTIPKTCYNSSKTAGFPLQVFENSSVEVSEKSEIVVTQAPELGQTVRREADNLMTGSDFDWMVSNHAVWRWKAPVKASVSGVSLLQLSPLFASIFPFSPRND